VDFPIAIACCLPGHSANILFDGVLGKTVDFEALVDGNVVKTKEEAEEKLKMFFRFLSLEALQKPTAPFSLVMVAAQNDYFIPKYSSQIVLEHFRSSKLGICSKLILGGGHISSMMFRSSTFVESIITSFVMLQQLVGGTAQQSKL
jgi:hypothetical protein